jgi:hypothetical protein
MRYLLQPPVLSQKRRKKERREGGIYETKIQNRCYKGRKVIYEINGKLTNIYCVV